MKSSISITSHQTVLEKAVKMFGLAAVITTSALIYKGCPKVIHNMELSSNAKEIRIQADSLNIERAQKLFNKYKQENMISPLDEVKLPDYINQKETQRKDKIKREREQHVSKIAISILDSNLNVNEGIRKYKKSENLTQEEESKIFATYKQENERRIQEKKKKEIEETKKAQIARLDSIIAISKTESAEKELAKMFSHGYYTKEDSTNLYLKINNLKSQISKSNIEKAISDGNFTLAESLVKNERQNNIISKEDSINYFNKTEEIKKIKKEHEKKELTSEFERLITDSKIDSAKSLLKQANSSGIFAQNEIDEMRKKTKVESSEELYQKIRVSDYIQQKELTTRYLSLYSNRENKTEIIERLIISHFKGLEEGITNKEDHNHVYARLIDLNSVLNKYSKEKISLSNIVDLDYYINMIKSSEQDSSNQNQEIMMCEAHEEEIKVGDTVTNIFVPKSKIDYKLDYVIQRRKVIPDNSKGIVVDIRPNDILVEFFIADDSKWESIWPEVAKYHNSGRKKVASYRLSELRPVKTTIVKQETDGKKEKTPYNLERNIINREVQRLRTNFTNYK
jgi:hypothetical protein